MQSQLDAERARHRQKEPMPSEKSDRKSKLAGAFGMTHDKAPNASLYGYFYCFVVAAAAMKALCFMHYSNEKWFIRHVVVMEKVMVSKGNDNAAHSARQRLSQQSL